ncbi:MAG: RNA 2'-phosphotransferase, partial [Aureliella sp.]
MELITHAAVASTPEIRRVLDIGCGAGNNTIRLRQVYGRDFDSDLLDLSVPMLERAELRVREAGANKIRLWQSDFRTADLPEGSFDVVLAAGTVAPFIYSISQQGLRKRSRNHVHLSADEYTAVKVAQRRGKPIVLIIESGKMEHSGHNFFLSANGVWLTNEVPTEFIHFEYPALMLTDTSFLRNPNYH